jgi:ATP-dependent Clp protease ATP-binding subunit ClpC
MRMFERFTDQGRHVVVVAQEEARTLNHHYIGTEHLLLALIREDTGTAAAVLRSLGITEAGARGQVEESVGRGRHNPPRGHIPITPAAKRTLELSVCEAVALGHASIGTEHILLSLLRHGDGEGTTPASQVLQALGADPDSVRQRVVGLVSGRQSLPSGSARYACAYRHARLYRQARPAGCAASSGSARSSASAAADSTASPEAS